MSGLDKRITELTELANLSADEFVHVDSPSGGSKKYNLKNIQDQIDAIPVAQIETNQQNIEANTEDIDELKDDLETFENALRYTNNPQVPDKYFTLTNVGKDLNYLGQLTDNSATDTSDYIEITDDLYDICRVVANTTKYGMSSICYYASDKSFIRRDLPGTNYDFSTFGEQTVVWFNIDKTTPGIKYVRFNTEIARGFNYWVVYDVPHVGMIEGIQEDISEIKEAIGFEVAPIAPSDYLAMNANTGLDYLGQTTSDNGQEASDYISLDNLYDVCRVVQNKTKYGLGSICYYSSTKNFIQRVQPGTNYDFSIFNGDTVVWLSIDKTISNAAYIRFCGDNNRGFKYWAVEYGNKASALDDYSKLPFYGKKIVNFGDSIFGQTRPPKDVSSYLAEKTGATVYNCGFGGCEMSVHADSNYDAFSMYRLADAVATNTWTLQETAATASGMPAYFAETVALLKTIDFSKVDVVTIGYGTNDWNNGTELDNGGNSNKAYFADALRYSIETLLTAFPNLKIFICTQTYRFFMDASYNFVDDSNTHTNSHGKTLIDFVEKTIEVSEQYNLPYINNYNIGMGKYSRSYYFYPTDGTHPKPEGNMLIASNMANKLF